MYNHSEYMYQRDIFIDYYEILQVSPNAEADVIEAAYKKLAQKYHPDKNRNPDANEKMKLINIAHDTLSNNEKRKAYHILWSQRQTNNADQRKEILITDHRWHNISYNDLKAWVKRRKNMIDSGVELKGRYFRYRFNIDTKSYQFRLRYRRKSAIYKLS
jgi:curved DNA-binding protein CbpA